MKVKNVPKSLKCKINTKKFLDKGFPKGGGPTFGKNSQIMSLFFFESVPKFPLLNLVFLIVNGAIGEI